MTKKLTRQEKAIRLLKKAYKFGINCDHMCGNCLFVKLGKEENFKKFGNNACEGVQLRHVLRELYGRETFND